MRKNNKSNVLIRQKSYNSVLLLLNSILQGKKYPDILISELFRNEDFSSDEKTVIVDLVYGILRHLGRLDYIIGHASRATITNLDPDILNSIQDMHIPGLIYECIGSRNSKQCSSDVIGQ